MFGGRSFPSNRKQRATRVQATFSRQDRRADRAPLLFSKIDLFLSVAAVAHRCFKEFTKLSPELRQIDPILRALRSGDAWLHVRQIQIDIDAVINFAFSRHAKHLLRTKVIFESKALLFAASRSP